MVEGKLLQASICAEGPRGSEGAGKGSCRGLDHTLMHSSVGPCDHSRDVKHVGLCCSLCGMTLRQSSGRLRKVAPWKSADRSEL
jgi:hypothetical protein